MSVTYLQKRMRVSKNGETKERKAELMLPQGRLSQFHVNIFTILPLK